MQNVPKIVRDRLQRPGSMPAEPHPEADLLTAFVEQALAADERERVLRHLAQCGDCREIVHLAQPATEVTSPQPASRRTQAGWLRWPDLRWAVVAAGILAVTSIGVLQFRQHQGKTKVASGLVPREQLASAERSAPLSPLGSASPTSSQPTAALSRPSGEEGKRAEIRKKMASAQALSAEKTTTTANADSLRSSQVHGRTRSSSAGTTIGGPVPREVTPDRAFAFAPPRPNPANVSAARQNPPVPAASEAVEVAGAAPPVETETAAQNATQDPLVQNQAAVKLQASSEQNEAVVRAKPTSSPVKGLASADELQNNALMKNPAPRWTLAANGALQRSLDGGKTWLDVNLAADSSMNSNLVSQSNSHLMIAKNSRAHTETKADSKPRYASAPAPLAPVIFRALAISSNAAEVWAGGSAGVLYHTMDGGNLWVRVVPSDAGVALSGDIVSIQFSDSRHGTVTTSTAAAWTTSDDGQSWHQQK